MVDEYIWATVYLIEDSMIKNLREKKAHLIHHMFVSHLPETNFEAFDSKYKVIYKIMTHKHKII